MIKRNIPSCYSQLYQIIILICTIAIMSGCGSSEVGVIDPDATYIGPEGRTVASSDGKASAFFPPGALAWKTAVSIKPASEIPEGHIWAPYEFSLGNINFLQPVTISISYDKDTVPTGLKESDLRLAKMIKNELDYLTDTQLDLQNGILSAKVDHFSSYNIVNTGNVPTGVKSFPVNYRLMNSKLARGVKIIWKPVLGATSYNIYWSTIPGVDKESGHRIINVTSPYIHEDLSFGARYYYIITAVKNDLEENESLETSAMPGSDYLSGGLEHTAVVKDDGTVWTWGYNQWGQLGDGTTEDRAIPVQVQGLSDVIAVAAGRTMTIVLKNDGTVWTWGTNTIGELGDGSSINEKRYHPGQVYGLTDVVAIAAGWTNGAALKSDGTVWTWGENTHGTLGDGTTVSWSVIPVQVVGLTDIIAISMKRAHVLALRRDGTIWAWGHNRRGQLGDGTHTGESKIPVPTPVQVSNFKDPDATISAGYWHSIAMKSDGQVLTWGRNSAAQLCDGTDVINSEPVDKTAPANSTGLGDLLSINGGEDYTISLKRDGTVWMCGNNSKGTLGIEEPKALISTPTQVPDLSDVVAIASGRYFHVVLKQNGTIWAWGFRELGSPLGDGKTYELSTVPLRILMDPLF